MRLCYVNFELTLPYDTFVFLPRFKFLDFVRQTQWKPEHIPFWPIRKKFQWYVTVLQTTLLKIVP